MAIRRTIEEAVRIEPKVKEKKKRTFKQSRAQKQHLETLKFINEMKQKGSKQLKEEDEV